MSDQSAKAESDALSRQVTLFAESVADSINALKDRPMLRFGTVTAVSGAKVTVKVGNDTFAAPKMRGYGDAKVNDRVALLQSSGTILILGAVG